MRARLTGLYCRHIRRSITDGVVTAIHSSMQRVKALRNIALISAHMLHKAQENLCQSVLLSVRNAALYSFQCLEIRGVYSVLPPVVINMGEERIGLDSGLHTGPERGITALNMSQSTG